MSQYDMTDDLKINVGHCDLYFMVQWFCLISWRLFDVWTSYIGIMSQYDPMFDLKLIVGHCDQWFFSYILKTIWCMNILLWDYESVWHNIWPQNKCRLLGPILCSTAILPYTLKTILYMNTILWDYESVWPDVSPQNIYSTLWPIFHGPVSLSNILKTFQWLNIILWDYESVWLDSWPPSICRSLWLCPLPWRLFDVWTSYFLIMSQYDMTFDLEINVGHCDLYFMVQWFCFLP